MTGTEVLFKNEHRVVEMINNGVRYRQIGKTFGVSKDVVSYFCKLNGLSRGANKNSEEDAARKIKEKSDGLLEYISGYTVKEKPVKVRCVVCGGEFERTFHNLTTKGRVTCPHCIERNRKHKAEAKEAERASKKKLREQRAKERQEESERKKAERVHNCPVCGKETDRPKYCCSECARKADNKRRDINRRTKLKMAKVDNDITVEGLYRRDNGVCYLCGRRCNYEDYTVIDGNFIAGDWYPSIDHIVPLKMGGKHSWGNVRLAHRLCNSKKSDKELNSLIPLCRETS